MQKGSRVNATNLICAQREEQEKICVRKGFFFFLWGGGGLGWTFEPCLVWADVELVHITLHQKDIEHKLPFRGQIPLRHTDTQAHLTSSVCDSAVVIINVMSIPTATNSYSSSSMFDVSKYARGRMRMDWAAETNIKHNQSPILSQHLNLNFCF